MKRTAIALIALVAGVVVPAGPAGAAGIGRPLRAPVVSTVWLEAHASSPGISIVDIRPAIDYAAGHIKNSINIPFEVPQSTWIVQRDGLLLELPDPVQLSAALGRFGLTSRSTVVLVTGANTPPTAQAGGTRVAMTLGYVGLNDVSILDGGFRKWVADGRPVSTEVPAVAERTFGGTVNAAPFVGTDAVRAAIGHSAIVDARDAKVYSGEVVESYTDKAGHIPSAISIPTPSLFNTDGTYKSLQELRSIFTSALGADPHREIIVYCGVGGYASTTLFVMTRMLRYDNVKFYDGSAQEWGRTNDMQH